MMGEALVPKADIDLQELSMILEQLAVQVRNAVGHHGELSDRFTPTEAPATRDHMIGAAESLYRERRRRERLFAGYTDLLSDHVLDMLLALYIGHERHSAVSLSSACYAAGAPQSTGLRYVARLEQRGLIARVNDPLDKRRQLLDLTDTGMSLMERYLAGYPDAA